MEMGKKGFTIIEVIAFFAVSLALIAGIMVGTGTSINRERYNDSVESFKAFLQEQYTLTANPQSAKYGTSRCEGKDDNNALVAWEELDGIDKERTVMKGAWDQATYTFINDANTDGPLRGRSNCLMYGRLIEFVGVASGGVTGWSSNGEVRITPVVGLDLESLGASITNDPDKNNSSSITNNDLEYKLKLSNMNDNELLREAKLGRDGPGEVYPLEWGAYVDAFFPPSIDMDQIPAQGAILIVRAPFSTTIRTFIVPYNNGTNYQGSNPALAYSGPSTFNLRDAFIPVKNLSCGGSEPLKCAENVASMASYQTTPRYFCVIPHDTNFMSNARKVVRVAQNGGGSSAVDILSESDTITCPKYTR